MYVRLSVYSLLWGLMNANMFSTVSALFHFREFLIAFRGGPLETWE